jgi:two-component system, OmpR family, response regulator RegX3
MIRVLLVEDEESFSDALSYLLRKQGFQVAVCPSGPGALEMFDRDEADLVLLDLLLPGPAGTDVCQSLCQRDQRDDDHADRHRHRGRHGGRARAGRR